MPTIEPVSQVVDYNLWTAGGNFINNYENRLKISYKIEAPQTFVHTIAFKSIENKGYQGVLRVIHTNSFAPASSVYDIKVETFGQVVVHKMGQEVSISSFF